MEKSAHKLELLRRIAELEKNSFGILTSRTTPKRIR